jgi:hypothetical protein
MTPLAILYSLPLVLFIGIGSMSLEFIRHEQNHWFFQGWLVATLGSFLFSLITMNNTLFPDRHIEYIMVPVCYVGAVGVLHLHRLEWKTPRMLWKMINPHTLVKSVFLVFVVLVLLGNAVALYPAVDSFEWSDERIQTPTLNTIQWMEDHLDVNTTVVATDLKLSKLLWASGYQVTYQYTNSTWVCNQWKECVDDLDTKIIDGDFAHDRVSHIFIDDIMREYSVNLDLFHTLYMTNSSYEKFQKNPFTLVYRNVTCAEDGSVDHWAELYEINWLYIDFFRYL